MTIRYEALVSSFFSRDATPLLEAGQMSQDRVKDQTKCPGGHQHIRSSCQRQRRSDAGTPAVSEFSQSHPNHLAPPTLRIARAIRTDHAHTHRAADRASCASPAPPSSRHLTPASRSSPTRRSSRGGSPNAVLLRPSCRGPNEQQRFKQII